MLNGTELIEAIANKRRKDGKTNYDSEIMLEIQSLSSEELYELVLDGDVLF